jgi:hypothetical protein
MEPNGTNLQVTPRVRTYDRFFDRDGKPITVLDWAALRSDPAYCRVGYWEGEGGAWIYTFWLGLDISFGVGGEATAIFDTHVSAFGNQPYADSNCPSDTLERAQCVHQRVVEYVTQGITPDEWHLDDI